MVLHECYRTAARTSLSSLKLKFIHETTTLCVHSPDGSAAATCWLIQTISNNKAPRFGIDSKFQLTLTFNISVLQEGRHFTLAIANISSKFVSTSLRSGSERDERTDRRADGRRHSITRPVGGGPYFKSFWEIAVQGRPLAVLCILLWQRFWCTGVVFALASQVKLRILYEYTLC